MGTFAPIQLLQTATNKLIWGAFDDLNDKYLAYAVYYGAVSTLPVTTELFSQGCILVHKLEQNVYINIGTDGGVPSWLLVGGTSVPIFPPLTARGDILTHNGTVAVIQPVGLNGTIPTADSSSPNGWVWRAPGGIISPSVTNTSQATSGGVQVPTLTWSHTSSGIDRGLVVEIETEQLGTVTGVTYNGIPLTQQVTITDAPNNLRNEIWFLIAPPVGSYNIIVSVAPNSFLTCFAQTIEGVNQTSPVGATQTGAGSSVTPTLTLNTTADFSLIIDSLCSIGITAYTAGAGQTSNGSELTASRRGASSLQIAGSTPDAVIMNGTIVPSSPWLTTAIEIKGIASGSATGTSVSTSVTQIAHGFVAGDVVRMDATAVYVKSQANNDANQEVTGYVNSVLDANTFILVTEGFITGAIPVNTEGKMYFLSPAVAGIMTPTETTTPGEISKPLMMIIDSGNLGYFHNYRGKIIPTSSGSTITELSIDINQVAHGLVVGDVIKSNGTDDEFATAQADSLANSQVVGVVTFVTDADNFTYVSQAVQLNGGFVPAGTPGDVIYLSPTSAGGMTTTKPVGATQIVRIIGNITASAATMYLNPCGLDDRMLPNSQIFVGNASNHPTAVAMTGDVSIDNAGVTTVDSIDMEVATITNIASTEIPIGTAAGVVVFNALSGDVTMNNAGVVTIGAAKILLGMLGAGITTVSRALYDQLYTTVGGAATEVITLAGVVATDRVQVTLANDGTNNVSVLSAFTGVGNVSVVFSADPGNDAIINLLVTKTTT